jgi:hypothetical protein
MAEVIVEERNVGALVSRPDWGAIWAGVFTFIGIWSVFGLLGSAIFATAANPNSVRPVSSGMNVGMAIWAIILTIVAMYVAGNVTTYLGAITSQRDGVVHGMVMFGLAVTAALVVAVIAGITVPVAATPGVEHGPYLLDMFADLGWIGFLSLFFGWLAAIGGATAATRSRMHSAAVQHQVGHA